MIKFCFWTGAIYAAAGFYGSWWSLGRMAAFGGGPNIFARVIATAILASLYLWARTGKLRWLLAMPFLIPCLIASGSRGGVGSLAVTLPFALTTIIRASRRVRGLIIGSAITALVLSQWLWDTFADVWRFRFVELTFERQYAADRDLLYAQAWDVFLENKPFGIGLDGFSQVAAGVYPHNLFLQVLSEGGITGMLLLLIPFWFMLRRLTYRRTLGQTFAFWIGTFYLSSSMFSGTYLDSRFIWIFFLIAMTGVRTETLRPSDTKLLTKSPGAWLGGPPILSGRQ
jgi:O-antigen ligase